VINIFSIVFISFFFALIKTKLQVYSSLSFARLSYGRTTDKLAINWQNIVQVGL